MVVIVLVDGVRIIFLRIKNLKCIKKDDVPLVEFMYLVFTRMPGENYRRRLRPLLLYLSDVIRALINSLVC